MKTRKLWIENDRGILYLHFKEPEWQPDSCCWWSSGYFNLCQEAAEDLFEDLPAPGQLLEVTYRLGTLWEA